MKNFVDFINDVINASKRSKLGSELKKKFFDLLNKKGVTAQVLHKFFVDNGYGGVSLDDCKKILGFPANIIIGPGGDKY